jgi:hypothetical protein
MGFAFKAIWIIGTVVWVLLSLSSLFDPGVQRELARVDEAGTPRLLVFLVILLGPPLVVYAVGHFGWKAITKDSEHGRTSPGCSDLYRGEHHGLTLRTSRFYGIERAANTPQIPTNARPQFP